MSIGQIKLYLLLLIIAFIPWSTAITSGATLLLVAVWILEGNFKTKFKTLFAQKGLLLLISFYLLHVLALLYSSDLKEGFFTLEKKLSLLAFPLVLGSGWYNEHNTREKALWTLTITTTLASLFCFSYALYRNFYIGEPATLNYSFEQNFNIKGPFTSIHWDYFSYTELIAPLKLHPSYFALYVILSLLFLLAVGLTNSIRSRKHKISLVGVGLFLSLILLLLSSRIGILAFIVCLGSGLVLIAIRENNKNKILITGSLVIVSIIAALFIFPITRYRPIDEVVSLNLEMPSAAVNEASGVSMRMVHWHAAAAIIKANPLFGVGTGDAQAALNSKYDEFGYADFTGYNAHNQYLQTTATVGILGLIILVSLLILGFTSNLKTREYIGAVFFILLTIVFFTEVFLLSNKGIVFISVFASLYLQRDTTLTTKN